VIATSSTVCDRKVENEYFKLQKELRQEQEKNRNLKTELLELQEAIKDLQSKIADLERIIDILRERIYELERRNISIHDDLINQITELKEKLSWKSTAGKPRNNNTTDQNVITLRAEGKTIRQICQETELSTATVTKILKS
jgi:archaellum component FlaC